MILKTKFIELVDELLNNFKRTQSLEDYQKLLDLQATLVKGHAYSGNNKDRLSLLLSNYNGFLAELAVENFLKRNKIDFSYDGYDYYQNYVIQYGDPFLNGKDTCDLIINGKRIDIKKTRWYYPFYNKEDLVNNQYFWNSVNYYLNKEDEIKRKRIDYIFLVDNDLSLFVIDTKTKNLIYAVNSLKKAEPVIIKF